MNDTCDARHCRKPTGITLQYERAELCDDHFTAYENQKPVTLSGGRVIELEVIRRPM